MFAPDRHHRASDVEQHYWGLFPETDCTQVTGEASPYYLYVNPMSVSQFMPLVRLVVSLREPVGRSLSEYESRRTAQFVLMYYEHRLGRPKRDEIDGHIPGDHVPSFHQIVQEGRRAMALCQEPTWVHSIMDVPHADAAPECFVSPFLGAGYYERYLRKWITVFSRLQLHVVDFEDLKARPETVMSTLAFFLGLPAHPFQTSLVYNSAQCRGCGTDRAVPRSMHAPEASSRVMVCRFHLPNIC